MLEQTKPGFSQLRNLCIDRLTDETDITSDVIAYQTHLKHDSHDLLYK